jgi:sugar O-acyltransferase (sialic acid O-acetyltransferase NeuD family)
MKILCIYGCGGLGRELLDIARRLDLWPSIVFVDDYTDKKTVNDTPVFSLEEILNQSGEDVLEFVIAVGEPSSRKALCEKLQSRSLNCIRLYDPGFVPSGFTSIGQGTVVHTGAVITCNTSIGRGCLISKQAHVGHDVEIGNFCVVSPGACVSGGARIGDNTYIGTGAMIRNGVSIGSHSIIGMGSVVLKDVEESSVMVGNPAVLLRQNTEATVFKAK